MPSTGDMFAINLNHIRGGLPFSWALLLLLAFSGCAMVPDIKHKPQFINPFPQLKTVAVLPFSNQSEEPTLSGERISLAYMNEIQSIRGFEVLPLGAVKAKLASWIAQGRPLGAGKDFQEFAQYLDVDAVLVGSITDYDAYYPPRMTMAVKWYSANPGFHPVLPGYGLPWGTDAEEDIPKWIQDEAQRALAAEQLKSQTPLEHSYQMQPIMPEDRPAAGSREQLPPPPEVTTASAIQVMDNEQAMPGEWIDHAGLEDANDALPPEWPDPRGFIPDPPRANRPEFAAQHAPIFSHMRNFNGHDEDLTEALEEYFYFRDDARFGGWQAYLQRSEDFIRFCCYLHLTETLALRGGEDESRLILRWPIGRYTR